MSVLNLITKKMFRNWLLIGVIVFIVLGGILFLGKGGEETGDGSGTTGTEVGLLGYDPPTDAWITIDSLVKFHGIGHPASPLPDYWPPVILQVPDELGGGWIEVQDPDDPWFDVPSDPIPLYPFAQLNLPEGVSQPPAGTYSTPFFPSFNGDIPTLFTGAQTLEAFFTLILFGSDGDPYLMPDSNEPFEFRVPVTVEVFAQEDWPSDTSIFTDGFESGDTSAWGSAGP